MLIDNTEYTIISQNDWINFTDKLSSPWLLHKLWTIERMFESAYIFKDEIHYATIGTANGREFTKSNYQDIVKDPDMIINMREQIQYVTVHKYKKIDRV